MNDLNKHEQEENTVAKLDLIIKKKKEEIAGLQKLLGSIEDASAPAEPGKIEETEDPGDQES